MAAEHANGHDDVVDLRRRVAVFDESIDERL